MASKTVLRSKRTIRGVRRAAPAGTDPRETPAVRPNLPHWNWRTFPVFAAFVAGLLLDSIINPPASGLGMALRVIGLLGAGYVLAHVIVVNVIVAGRIRARDKVLAAGEDPEVEWVDEVVHPDEQ